MRSAPRFVVLAWSAFLIASAALAQDGPVPKGYEVIYYDVPDESGRLEGGSLLGLLTDRVELRARVTPAPFSSMMVNGPAANRIDMVLVGDGYQEPDLNLYQAHAAIGLSQLFGIEPFASYEAFFNVHVIEVVSPESGVDNDPTLGIERDTALDMGFWCSGIERLLCVDVTKAYGYANNAPDVDQVLAIANSTKYGGAGYTSSELATFSGGNGQSPQVAIHELGHSLGDLADEYFSTGTYTGPEPVAPNVSTLNAAQMVSAQTKWANWMYELIPPFDGPVNTYLGGMQYSNGIYRPSNYSMMRVLGRQFNPPSAEAFIEEFYLIVDPIDDSTPQGLVDENDTLFVVPLHPTHGLDVQWYADGVPIAGATSDTLDLGLIALTPGLHQITVVVVDNTPWVRDEAARASLMTETRAWQVDVGPPVDVAVTCASTLPVTLFAKPDGTGDPLTAAQVWDGVPGSTPSRVDATITVTLTREGTPVVGLPAERIQLVPAAGGWTLCDGVLFADGPTDAGGTTTFSGALPAGGYGLPGDLVEIVVLGVPLGSMTYPEDAAGLDVRVISPDNNGDMLVDLIDLGTFAQDFYGYDERSDYHWNGVTDLIEVGLFASALGAACPGAEQVRPTSIAGTSIGLAFDRDGRSRSLTLQPGERVTGYVLLEGVEVATAWRAQLETSPNVIVETVGLPGGSLNLGRGHDFLVGTGPLQREGSRPILLATLTLTVTDNAPARLAIGSAPLFGDGHAVRRATVSTEARVNARSATPTAVHLRNHPNPFNPSTQILFDLPHEGHATVRIYDVGGRRVAEIGNRTLSAGPQSLLWDGTDHHGGRVVSGLYFYRLLLDDKIIGSTRKMTLLK